MTNIADLNQLINGPLIGIAMKYCAKRATDLIESMRFTFKATEKEPRPDGKPNWVTDADVKAQKIYTKILRECFSNFGIVGEEEELNIPCTIPGHNIYFTVDPLDGTSAYNRKASSGVGTMCSLVWNDVVIAVLVGDVLTGEVYYFRPDSDNTHRIDSTGFSTSLQIDTERTLKSQYLLLRSAPAKHTGVARLIADRSVDGQLFSDIGIDSGSIGLSMARLWKGEVGGAILLPQKQTPWDVNPVIGMNKRLGFRTFKLLNTLVTEKDPLPKAETYTNTHQMLVIHKSRVEEFETWLNAVDVNLMVL